jgi:ApbE superfamily uncharacterized protein (UPF0280 family)
MIKILADGSALVSQGPLHMTIAVSKEGIPSPGLAQEGAEKALELLKTLADLLSVIKRRSHTIKRVQGLPSIVQRMIQATQQMEDPYLTPLAAVAGAVSDEVADFLEARDGSRIIVNNGGDIALRLRRDETIKVGVRLDVQRQACAYSLMVTGMMGIGGVATSGLGGRSFTKGLASAVVAIGQSAVYADAAATVLGNSTWVDDPNIDTELAEKLYPDTDIAGQRVVIKVGQIEEKKIGEAMQNGLRTASLLIDKGLIRGGIVALKGRVAWTPNIECRGRNLYVMG